MKRYLKAFLVGLCAAVIPGGCTKKENADLSARITNRNIPVADVRDFYYTYENINYNAFYQRYRFYAEDGKYMFFHETRERPNDYGWTTEEDRTAVGTIEIGEAGWAEAMELLKDGTVSRRKDSAEAGDSGPWLYIYWKGDKDKDQVFAFASYKDLKTFEEYCRKLAEKKH